MQGPLKTYPPIVRLPLPSCMPLSPSFLLPFVSFPLTRLLLIFCPSPEQTGAEFIAQAMKVRLASRCLTVVILMLTLGFTFLQRNYEAALVNAKLQTYEVSEETLEANKDFVVSGTGVARPVAASA